MEALHPTAVILDFDGVVVDSLAAHLEAWCAAVQEIFRRPLPTPDELAGHATRTIAQILCRRYGDTTLAPALVRAKERLLAERPGGVPLLPGARELVAALAKAGTPHGIASNSTRGFVHSALAAAGLTVPVVITGDDVSRAKPEPDIFWECANRLRVAPGDRPRVLVFEDSLHGLDAARRAGMMPVGVTSAVSAAKLRRGGAVAVCADLGEALAKGWDKRLPAEPEG